MVGDLSYLQDIKRLYMKKYSVVVCKFLLKYAPYPVGMLMAILCAGCTALFSSSSSLPLTCGNRKTASDSMITTVKLHAHGLKTQLQILINHMHTQSVHVCSIAIVDSNIYGLILVSSLSTCEAGFSFALVSQLRWFRVCVPTVPCYSSFCFVCNSGKTTGGMGSGATTNFRVGKAVH